MRRWAPAVTTLAGVAATVLAATLVGPVWACGVAIATLCLAASGPSIVGGTTIHEAATVDPSDVRRHRLDHPGTTISDAVAAVADHPSREL